MTLLYIYIASFVVGGILLGASLLIDTDKDFDAADVDMDVDVDVDVDVDADIDLDIDADADADIGVGHGADFWLPFLSVRFWVFFLAFFGATGSVLTLFALASKWTTLGASLGMGGGLGFSAAYILQRLKRQVIGDVVGAEHYKGVEGVVLIPLSKDARGKVRLTVRGQAIDFAARTDAEAKIEIGASVLVIDVDGRELVVVPAADLSKTREEAAASSVEARVDADVAVAARENDDDDDDDDDAWSEGQAPKEPLALEPAQPKQSVADLVGDAVAQAEPVAVGRRKKDGDGDKS